MKFLVLTQYFPPEVGATQVRLASLCKELCRAGHTVEVVTGMPHHPTGKIFSAHRGRLYAREHLYGATVHRVWLYPGNRSSIQRLLGYFSFALMCLLGLARAAQPDYLFVDSPPLFLGVSGWIAARLRRARLIFNVADLWPDSARDLGVIRDGTSMRLGYMLERWIYRRADFVTAVTEGIRETLLTYKHVPAHKVLFLPNGVDTQLFAPRPPDQALKRRLGLAGKQVVLYAGNHGYAGAVEQVICAAFFLRESPLIHFLLIGDGPEKDKITEMADALGISNVSFHDSVPLEKLPAYISISDMALATLRKSRITEGTRPAKVLVMMAAAKPQAVAASGEAAALVELAEAGVVAPPEDSKALAEAIRAVLSDPEAAKKMGQKGRAFVKAHYEWSALVKNWLAQLSGTTQAGEQTPVPATRERRLHASP
ncbi:MAG: glycosyltransferase family 4 protein [Candidatus Acidiferrales bacterium]